MKIINDANQRVNEVENFVVNCINLEHDTLFIFGCIMIIVDLNRNLWFKGGGPRSYSRNEGSEFIYKDQIVTLKE